MNIYDYLSNNSYPGRGIIVGKYKEKMLLAYFIMGRSENSRNRVFKKKDDTVYTDVYDETKVKDPSLIIYNAIRTFDDLTIVTNGNQTNTIYDYLKLGKSYKDALLTREYEPDAPNYTPRISAILNKDSYTLSILKKKDENCERLYYQYVGKNGVGHFISTYNHDGSPLPSFDKEPIEIEIEDDIDIFSAKLWNSLNNENKISLYVRYIDNDSYLERMFNKNGD